MGLPNSGGGSDDEAGILSDGFYKTLFLPLVENACNGANRITILLISGTVDFVIGSIDMSSAQKLWQRSFANRDVGRVSLPAPASEMRAWR